MARSRLLVGLMGWLIACSGAPIEEQQGSQDSALGGYSRRGVHDAVVSHARAANDLLRVGYTDDRLVAALGWLHDHGPAFQISAIRSDHPTRDSVNAHAGGFSADLYALNSSQMSALLRAIDQNPYVYEVGFGGAYKNYRSSITSKATFNDNNQTHVHIGVIHAYGHGQSTSTPAPASTGGESCNSFTLGRIVEPGTCVRREDDDNWYVCDGARPADWPSVSGPDDSRCTTCPQLDDGSCSETTTTKDGDSDLPSK